jgi:5-methylcytosine-specific restriction endonuclease McrA
MAKFDPIARHPITEPPYDKIQFVKMTPKRVPLYRVAGADGVLRKASKALAVAFSVHGGSCFYCACKFKPQSLGTKVAHRDHVVPSSRGGSTALHNLVFACRRCGTAKADKLLHEFSAEATAKMVAALERHIARAVGAVKD